MKVSQRGMEVLGGAQAHMNELMWNVNAYHSEMQLNIKCYSGILRDVAITRPQHSPAQSQSTESSQSSSPHPLFTPSTLIIGDTFTRKICFFNAATHCFPGATVLVILDKLPVQLCSLPWSINRVIVHVGSNGTAHLQTKKDFNALFSLLNVWLSGPLPTLGRGDERFYRILSLNTWLQSTCRIHNIGFIDNFNLFWSRPSLFRPDGLHLNNSGSTVLAANIQHAIQTAAPRNWQLTCPTPHLEPSSSSPPTLTAHSAVSLTSSPWEPTQVLTLPMAQCPSHGPLSPSGCHKPTSTPVINSIPIPVVISHCKLIHPHIVHSVLAIPARSANTKPDTSNLTFGLFNICSLTNKGPLLFDLQNDHKFDFFYLTETWQQPNDFSDLNQTIPPGFVYSSQPRTSGRGGGLAILYNQICKVSSITVPVYPSFESIALQIKGPTPTISSHYLSTTQAE